MKSIIKNIIPIVRTAKRNILLTSEGVCKMKENNFSLQAFQTVCQYSILSLSQDLLFEDRLQNLVKQDFQLPWLLQDYKPNMYQQQITARSLCCSLKLKYLQYSALKFDTTETLDQIYWRFTFKHCGVLTLHVLNYIVQSFFKIVRDD